METELKEVWDSGEKKSFGMFNKTWNIGLEKQSANQK